MRRRLHTAAAAPEADTVPADIEPGAILDDDQLEALAERSARRSAPPPPRLRLVEATLDRQVAAKRERRTLPQLLLATGAMQCVQLSRWARLAIALRAWRARAAHRLQQWRARVNNGLILRRARNRCRAHLRAETR